MLASSNRSLHGDVSHELVPESSLLKPIIVELKTTQVITLYSNNIDLYSPAINKNGKIKSRQKLT